MTREEAIAELSVIWERLSHPEDCENGCYSFRDGDYLEALDMAIEALSNADRPTGECRTCGRNADNGGVHEDGRTKCPIQEHYALLLDGYCHLYEPYGCGAKMGVEDNE